MTISRRTWIASLALLLSASAWQGPGRAQATRVPVILLSIDGLKPDYVLEAGKHGLDVPNLRRMVAEGAFASGVIGVTPTVTYPSHTTLVTGVAPATHGILNNGPFDPLGQNANGWFWYAEDIKVPTLWDVAGDAGLVTANVDWPVTVGARIRHNIVQYWHGAPGEDHKLLRSLSTPGLLDEAEKDVGPYPAGYQYTLADDQKRARFVAWMIEKKRPDLLTAYMSSLDEEQHHTAPYSKTTFETLEGLDALVGQVRAAAERAYGPRFVLAVVSDHGHITATRDVHLNAALARAGLIDVDAQGKVTGWRAFAWSAGGSAAIVLKDPSDATARDAARKALRVVADDPAGPLALVAEGAELRALRGFPDAAFVVGMKPGFKTGAALSGEVVRLASTSGGTHGYLPGPRDMESAFFIVGDGVPAGRNLGGIDMRDIAPTLAARLGVALPRAEGRNHLAPAAPAAPAAAVASAVEEIYIGRSWRETREPPMAFCEPARTGFGKASVEDTYTFRSLDVRGTDGRVVDADVATIGRLHACFGPQPESGSFFYAEGTLGDVPFTGRGECRTTKQDYPEPGMSVLRCFMELSGLPSAYVGGQLTTNTIGTRSTLGDRSDPPGYTQPSIATIRLWRHR